MTEKNEISRGSNPRVLIVSNNPLSTTENNGKTLLSLFNTYGYDEIAQLYFDKSNPTQRILSYFRISDYDIISSATHFSRALGSIVQPQELKIYNNPSRSSGVIRKSYFARLLREAFWRLLYRDTALLAWADQINPKVIFFMGGDFLFAYRIVTVLSRRYNAPTIFYVTDDYILARTTASPFFWLRRFFIEKNMREAIETASLFLTISDKMRKVYLRKFLKNSRLFRNDPGMSNSMVTITQQYHVNPVILVYAGGFHYNRWKVLVKLAKAICEHNSKSNIKLFLRVFCTQKVNRKIMNQISLPGASEFLGPLSHDDLQHEYETCHVLVHVESFDRYSKEAVGMSISTKIPEYLSLGKCIFAIGPKEVASMDYLKDTAYCLTDPSLITDKALGILADDKQRGYYSSLAKTKSKKPEDAIITSKQLSEIVLEIAQ